MKDRPFRDGAGFEQDGDPGRFSLSISILILLASGRGNPWVAPLVPAAKHRAGSRNCRS